MSLLDFSFDFFIVAAVILSGLLCGYFALMRQDAPPEKRKVIAFWGEVFLLALILLIMRLFHVAVPNITPDLFFLLLTLIAGGAWLWFSITRRSAEDPKKKDVVRLWRDLFICFCVVFIFRGFFIDYFRIPSSSMEPTLEIGDIVLTDKNAYGYRLPFFNTRLSAGEDPQRGDIIIFLKPRNNADNKFYIKRIIGIPGDRILYDDNKSLFINGEKINNAPLDEVNSGYLHFSEELASGAHSIQQREDASKILFYPPNAEHCTLLQTERGYNVDCTLPPDQYFVLGDNRDNSNDSRFWGFVPRDRIVGPAFRILINLQTFDRLFHSLALSPIVESDDVNLESASDKESTSEESSE